MLETEKKRLNAKLDTRALAVTAMLSAVAFVLMFLSFPIPAIIPSFVKMDASDLPELLAAFALGPVYGVVVAFVKNVLYVAIKGTSSALVGQLFSFVCGGVFAFAAGVLYHRSKSRRSAVIGSLAGAALMAVVSVPLNYYLVYPAYAAAFGGMEKVLAAYRAILPTVGGLMECLLIFNLPFTLVKGLLVALLCFLIYKPLSPVLHGNR